jgi:long-chain acyl-CoA synthetase
MVSCNAPGAFRFGTVGRPVRGTEVKIGEDGEILVRGGNVTTGYFGRADDTAAAFQDGWFRTGDVGALDGDGFLSVTDRIKDLIITSQGKNVAPQRVEGILGGDPYIEQLAVIGDNRKYLSALIEPAFPVLERYATEHGIAFTSRADLVSRPEILALYDERIAARSRELAGYEQVKRFTLLPREFTQADGELTPTLKIRRRMVEAAYADLIEAMYQPES